MDKHDGVAYAIECNPRLGSQISLFHPVDDMADIFLGHHGNKVVEPPIGKGTYTTVNELFMLIDPTFYADEEPNAESFLKRIARFMQIIQSGSDPIFDHDDMLPFFMINFFQMPLLLFDTMVANRPWKKIDFQIGKVVELGGY